MTLAERLAQLRESTNTSMVSNNLSPTSLSTYLAIYNKAKNEGDCYINYMEGAKILYKYLSPIEIPVIPDNLLPTYIPRLFHGYEVQQLAMILAPREAHNDLHNWIAYFTIVEKTIVYLTLKGLVK